MKKVFWFLVSAFLVMTTVAGAAVVYRVVNEEAAVRKDRRFFAPIVIRVPYGEQIQSQARQGDWLKVVYKGKQGWVHIGAVKEQKVQLSALAGGRAAETTRDEVALGGKGFTPEVEKAFRDKNPKMNYNLVDRVESYRVNDDELQAFVRSGKLIEPGAKS